MRSSDTPETEREWPQGPADWSKEIPSDDLLSDEAKERIRNLLEELRERGE